MTYGFEVIEEGIHLFQVGVGAFFGFTTGLDPVLVLRLHFEKLMSITPETEYDVRFLLELLCNEAVRTQFFDASNICRVS
jgi:sorbitol-specific phosphotransferase system component IIC